MKSQGALQMNNEIIVVKQLPVIEEQLQSIKKAVTAEVEDALQLVCTADTVNSVKDVRAKLNKQFAEFENKRKEVKKAVAAPYEQFELVYKDCITNVYKNADVELKNKIDSVEYELKEAKRVEIKEYFDEYLQAKNIDFITFENANINVTLSASMKSLKEQAKAFIDRVSDDLALIDTQEYKDEITVEYKNTLNVSNAITTVTARHKAIEEEKARQEERNKKALEEAAHIESLPVAQVIDEPLAAPKEAEPILTVKFTVKGTKSQLKVLKEFLNNEGYDYE